MNPIRHTMAASATAFALLLAGCGGGSPVPPPSVPPPPAAPVNHSLSVTISGSTGSVQSNPSGINCGSDCGEAYAAGTPVTLTAQAAAGFSFSGWSGACSGMSATCTVGMTEQRSVSASFAPIPPPGPVLPGPSAMLTVAVTGSGVVSSTPAGIACGSGCSASFVADTLVSLQATAADGHRFNGWGGACTGSAATCSVTMSQARSVSAAFVPLPPPTTPDPSHTALRVLIEGLGTVGSNPAGIQCGTDCSEMFAPATSVSLTAVAAPGFRFDQWSGNCTGSGACTVSMASGRTVIAKFAPVAAASQQLDLVVSGSGYVGSSPSGIHCGGGGTDCSEAYPFATQVALLARPAAGFIFDGWQGACAGLNTCQLGMTAARSATARFVPDPAQGNYALSVGKTGSGTVQSMPAGIDCGTDCSETYAAGSTVTLTARAAAGSVFNGWSGACSGLNPTCIVPLQAARSASASFGSPADASRPGPIDAIIAAMPPNSWKALPNSEMREVCPLPYDHPYFCETVVTAWSGGAYDEARERMFIYGGGHGDSYYNNVFVFDLVSLQWRRLTEMGPGATATAPAPGWNDHRLESCGFYPRGPVTLPASVMKGAYVDYAACFTEPVLSQLDLQQPRSAHTYGENYVDRLNGRYCFLGAGAYYISAQAGTQVSVCFDPQTLRWTRTADRPALVGGAGNAMVDSNGQVWSLASHAGYVARYDPAANTWRTYGYVNGGATGSADIDRRRNHAYVLHTHQDGNATFRGYALRRFDLNSPAALNASTAYTEMPTTGDAPVNIGLRPGFAYADGLDRLFAWGGGQDVYALNPATGEWKRTTGTGDNPGLQAQTGTFGRFRYSPARGVFVLVNSTRQNVYIYRPGTP
jgi:hypothetical protein